MHKNPMLQSMRLFSLMSFIYSFIHQLFVVDVVCFISMQIFLHFTVSVLWIWLTRSARLPSDRMNPNNLPMSLISAQERMTA